jgi:hypothetical protein
MSERPLLHVGLDLEALRNLVTRKPVILPASTAAWADAVSMPRMPANACGERTNTPQAAPVVASSSWQGQE